MHGALSRLTLGASVAALLLAAGMAAWPTTRAGQKRDPSFLDRLPLQVLIAPLFVEVSLNDDTALGLQATRFGFTGGDIPVPPSPKNPGVKPGVLVGGIPLPGAVEPLRLFATVNPLNGRLRGKWCLGETYGVFVGLLNGRRLSLTGTEAGGGKRGRIRFRGEDTGSGYTGSGTFTIPGESVKLKNTGVTLEVAPRVGADGTTIRLNLLPARAQKAERLAGTGSFTGVFGTIPLSVTGSAFGLADGNDRLSLIARGFRTRLRIVGDHNGTVLRTLVTGNSLRQRFRRLPASFPTGEDIRVTPLSPAGSGQRIISLGPDGTLSEDVTISTPNGGKFELSGGMKMRTGLARALTREAEILILDEPTSGLEDANASLQVYVRPIGGGPDIADLFVPVSFTPFGNYTRPLQLPAAGGFSVFRRAPRGRGTSPDGTPGGGGWSRYTGIPLDATRTGTMPVPGTGVYAIGFEPTPAGGVAAGSSLQCWEIEIPGDDTSEFPRVKDIEVRENRPEPFEFQTTLSITTAEGGDNGMTLNESRTDTRGDYSYSVIGRDGKRYVQVKTRFKNRVQIFVNYCSETEPFGRIGDVPDDPRPPGEDDDGPYRGALDLVFEGKGDYDDALDFFARLQDVLEVDTPAVFDSFQSLRGGGFRLFLRVIDYEDSAQTIEDRLGDGFGYEFSDRFVLVTENCPAPTLAVLGLDDDRVYVHDIATLAELRFTQLPGRPDKLIVSRNGRRAYVSVPGKSRIYLVDLVRSEIVKSVRIPKLSGGLGLDPSGQWLYATTERGEFRALDARTLRPAWTIRRLQKSFTNGFATTLDGSYGAYAAPLTKQLLGVDLTRRTAAAPLSLGGAQSAAFTDDGLTIGVPDIDASVVRFLDTATKSVLRTVPVGQTPTSSGFTADGDFLTPSFNASALSVVDGDDFLVWNVNGIAGANGLDVFETETGDARAIVSAFNEPHALYLIDIPNRQTLTSVLLNYQPGAVDVAGY